MKIKMLTGQREIMGIGTPKAGAVIDVSVQLAKDLINQGFATKPIAPKKKLNIKKVGDK